MLKNYLKKAIRSKNLKNLFLIFYQILYIILYEKTGESP